MSVGCKGQSSLATTLCLLCKRTGSGQGRPVVDRQLSGRSRRRQPRLDRPSQGVIRKPCPCATQRCPYGHGRWMPKKGSGLRPKPYWQVSNPSGDTRDSDKVGAYPDLRPSIEPTERRDYGGRARDNFLALRSRIPGVQEQSCSQNEHQDCTHGDDPHGTPPSASVLDKWFAARSPLILRCASVAFVAVPSKRVQTRLVASSFSPAAVRPLPGRSQQMWSQPRWHSSSTLDQWLGRILLQPVRVIRSGEILAEPESVEAAELLRAEAPN